MRSNEFVRGNDHDAAAFAEKYMEVWEESGEPGGDDINETFLAALHRVMPSKVTTAELSDLRLLPLFLFMCNHIEKNVPHYWFREYCPSHKKQQQQIFLAPGMDAEQLQPSLQGLMQSLVGIKRFIRDLTHGNQTDMEEEDRLIPICNIKDINKAPSNA